MSVKNATFALVYDAFTVADIGGVAMAQFEKGLSYVRSAQQQQGRWFHADGQARLKTAFGLGALAAVFYIAFVWLGVRSGHAPETLMRDPAATFGYWPFYGMLSHLGVFLMIATSAVCVFTAISVNESRSLLVLIGLFSGYFAMDDFFMLHESILPWYGVPEAAALGALALAALAIFIVFRVDFLTYRAVALWLAAMFLAMSVMSDLFVEYSVTQVLIEDGFKFIGLALWTIHWTLIARSAVQRRRTAT